MCRRASHRPGPVSASTFAAQPLRRRWLRCLSTSGLIRNEGKGETMADLSGMRFAETHEWVTNDGDTATVGISQYAQSQLGDVIYLELPAVGQQLAAGARLGVIEALQAPSTLYIPLPY